MRGVPATGIRRRTPQNMMMMRTDFGCLVLYYLIGGNGAISVKNIIRSLWLHKVPLAVEDQISRNRTTLEIQMSHSTSMECKDQDGIP